MNNQNERLAKHLARVVFALGDEPIDGGTVQRLQFMGGKYPNAEITLGGLCENALVAVIQRELDMIEINVGGLEGHQKAKRSDRH